MVGVLGEEPHPSNIGPEEGDEAPVGKALLQRRPHFAPHVLVFVERPEHHRHFLECLDRSIDFGDAGHGQDRRLDLAHAHPADHVGLSAHGPIGIDNDLNSG
jgi:hypothetical protein